MFKQNDECDRKNSEQILKVAISIPYESHLFSKMDKKLIFMSKSTIE